MRNDPGDVGTFPSHAAYKEHRDFRSYFWRVIVGYRSISELSPVVAMVWDPCETPKKLGVDGIHFICDVQIATQKALDNNPELFDQWQCLVNGEGSPNAASIIARCGRLYKSRRLAPASYLRFVKQGRPDRPQKIPAAGAA
jgi:hypothetical protein